MNIYFSIGTDTSWKLSFEIQVHVDMIVPRDSCRFFQVHVHAANLIYITFTYDLLCDTVHRHAGSSHWEMGPSWP